MQKFNHAPDGMFIDDVIIWGDIGDGSWSCGLSLLIPPMDYARNEDKNSLKHRIDSMLNFFSKENLRIQFYWSVGDNYSELQEYDDQTETLSEESLCYKYRKERFKEYEKQLSSRDLRREQLIVFISNEITGKLSKNLSNNAYDQASKKLLENIKNHARQQLSRASSFFETIGIASRRLNSHELCNIIKKYYNPSYAYAPVKENFDENLSIKENCIFSDITPSEEFSMVIDN